jgi:hypothetical protein
MDRFTQEVLPDFDFSEADSLSATERIERSIDLARELAADYPMCDGIPPVSDAAATSNEIDALEADLGVSIPSDLRAFWRCCRYLCLNDGMNIGGFDHNGVHVAESVWLSNDHMPDRRLLVFGAYWRFSDGDQLLIDLDDPTFPVIAYLHEHGPLFERYAPSVSSALWRLVHEIEE